MSCSSYYSAMDAAKHFADTGNQFGILFAILNIKH